MDVSDNNLQRRLSQSTELARGFMINYNLYRHYFPADRDGARSSLSAFLLTAVFG